MIVLVWYRDDGAGLDNDFRDRDVFQTHEDSFEGSLGNQEKKSFLIVKMDDPPNLAAVMAELEKSEYEPGPGETHVVRRARAYQFPYELFFTTAELAIIRDGTQMLPDGALEGGGSVTSGVVSGKFEYADRIRK